MRLVKQIKTIFKSIAVAFSIYSKIPMPRFKWESDDMKYHFIFFPWVGVLIGVLQYLWMVLSLRLSINDVSFGMISALLLIMVTGGLHIDGFIDTSDALHSYQNREKKLEILKDPHVGAFSIICLAGLGLLYCAVAIQLFSWKYEKGWMVMCCVFAIARAVSALMVLNLKPAKKDGMMRSESDSSNKSVVSVFLIIELLVFTAIMFSLSVKTAVLVAVVLTIFSACFREMIYKQFGGMTGDLAGYFVCVAEVLAGTAIAVSGLI